MPPKTKANLNDALCVVDWMTDNNIGKIMSEPTIVVLEGRPAQFQVGGEFPMPAKDTSKVVEYQPFGTQIDLLATSLGDDRVRLELRTRVSEVDEGSSIQVNGMKCPRLSVRQIDTGIVSTFGQPTVLTGMIKVRTETIRITSGVGEVANRVRGKASTRDVTNEICLMLVVTPERVDAPETAQRPVRQTTPR
jgi:pilus assembly protein CpaC